MVELPVRTGVLASALAFLGLGLAAGGWVSLRRRRWFLGATSGLGGFLLVLLGVIGWGVVLGTQGYRSLTKEELAATVSVTPRGEQAFRAVVERPDAAADTFRIAGDQLYVDAHVLKWHPWVNLLGVHTGYQLTRVGGRYRSLEDARSAERTVYALSEDGALDVFRTLDRTPLLTRLVDATYGSAAFVPVDRDATFEVRVTTSGLLIRARADSTAGAEEGAGASGPSHNPRPGSRVG